MARVIKGGGGAGGQKPPRPPTRVLVDAGLKKVIGRDVFQAKQDAEHILKRAEHERQLIIAEGKKMAARAREEAAARGSSEAFAAAAAEALTAFRKRAERYAEASDDVRVLALEVVKKVLGAEPDLGPAQVDKILQRGMAQLRARRRLRLQVSHKRLGELASERPNLMKALQSEPDLVVEGVDDVSTGFARVVTEIGGALCAEDNALDALSMAVNVREQPREARRGAAGHNTAVGDGPDGVSELRRGLPDAAHDDDVEEIEEVAAMEDETINLAPRARDVGRDRGRELGRDGREGGLTRRPQMAAERAQPLRGRPEEIEVIAAEEDDPDSTAAARAPRGGPAQVRPGGGARPATRVVPIDASEPSQEASAEEDVDATLRHAPLIERKDEDLDLFTDDAPRKRR